MNLENVHNKILEMFGSTPNNFNILEYQIDLNLQLEYFEFALELNRNEGRDKTLKSRDLLFDNYFPVDEKKKLLLKLAAIDKVEAFRTIERFAALKHPELYEWAILAQQESRMLLESFLLDESQVFISTGLGGQGNKLRYFVVITSKSGKHFTSVQKQVIRKEFEFAVQKYNAELEELNFADTFSTILVLIPIDVSIKSVFNEAIRECNQLGNFLTSDFIVTNVKILSNKEIEQFFDKQKIVGN